MGQPVTSADVAQRLGARMRTWRDQNQLTLEKSAAKVGLDLQQWHRWESGETKNPTLSSLMKIAAAMDTDLPTLIADIYPDDAKIEFA